LATIPGPLFAKSDFQNRAKASRRAYKEFQLEHPDFSFDDRSFCGTPKFAGNARGEKLDHDQIGAWAVGRLSDGQ
jgi:hypothetical protein